MIGCGQGDFCEVDAGHIRGDIVKTETASSLIGVEKFLELTDCKGCARIGGSVEAGGNCKMRPQIATASEGIAVARMARPSFGVCQKFSGQSLKLDMPACNREGQQGGLNVLFVLIARKVPVGHERQGMRQDAWKTGTAGNFSACDGIG